jgi:hypothetical protein
MQKPPLIKYNLRERGRQYRGQERNFNIKAICDSINSPATQERVRTRAMLGYFGHKMRLLSGMEPAESVVIGGKYNEVEPAIVTTHLKAYPDGTIEHQTEFLDTEPGRKAARMYASRVGGFSSAIDERKPEFYGFDWVHDPNYSTNRPYALDSAGLTFDSVLADAIKEEEDGWILVLEAKERELKDALLALDNAIAENEQYISLLAAKSIDPAHALDSAGVLPISVALDSAEQLRRDTEFFRQTAKLPHFVDPVTVDREQQGAYDDFMSRMGYGHV